MLERRMENRQALNRTSIFQPLPGAVMLTAILLTAGFAVLILATVAGLQLGNTLLRPSPFVPYEAIWPGQSIESLAGYARRTPEGSINCSAQVKPNQTYAGLTIQIMSQQYGGAISDKTTCIYQPQAGIFRSVNIALEAGQVQELQLFSDALPEDVLTLYWGMPDSIGRPETGQRLNLYWERSTYTAMASVVEPDAIVRLVTLTAKG